MANDTLNQTVLEKVPPQNLDAEHSVLGAMILSNDCISDVVQFLEPESFYSPANRVIFEEIRALYDSGQAVDLVILKNKLLDKNLLERAGGLEHLIEAAESVPSAANAAYYAKIVQQKAMQRSLIVTCTSILREAYDGMMETDELLDLAERQIFDIAENRVSSDMTKIQDVLMEVTNKLNDLRDNKWMMGGVPTGFLELDELTGGLHPSELTILAARPSMGKTSLALNIIDHVAVKEKKPVAFFSIEMARFQVVLNMICARAGVDSRVFRSGFVSDEVLGKVVEKASPLYEANIFIDDTSNLSISQLRAKARRLKARHSIDLIVIDYLQLMSAVAETREQEISAISRSLKALARELNVPIIALAQLNRQVEGRADHRPMLSDLRESGSLEQDADVVMFLSRDDYYAPDNPELKGRATLTVAKQRNGPTGAIQLVFRSKHMRFETYSPRQEPEDFS